jgi:hypothetical protein
MPEDHDWKERRARVERYRILAQETTDPIATRLLHDIVLDLEAELEDRRKMSALMLHERRRTPNSGCQSAFKFDPVSASNFDPFERRGLAVALVSSELAGIAETRRARVV